MSAAPGVYAEREALLALREQAHALPPLPSRNARGLFAGGHATRLRGRGLAFEELRPYWPGDDARLIDWKVTARLRRPFLRLFAEERDSSVLLLVDQRMNQFFGSRHALKSVLAAEAAALLGWAALARHDRVGAILFDDTDSCQLRPARSRRAFLHLLGELLRYNHALHARHPGDAPQQLNNVLAQVRQLAPRDHLLVLISDLYGLDAQTREHLAQLRRHNPLWICQTSDPLLSGVLPAGELLASDGHLQMPLDLDRSSLRQTFQRLRDQRQEQIQRWSNELAIALLPLTSAEPAATQLRHLLGQERRRG